MGVNVEVDFDVTLIFHSIALCDYSMIAKAGVNGDKGSCVNKQYNFDVLLVI